MCKIIWNKGIDGQQKISFVERMRQLYNSLNSRPSNTHNDDINDDNANNRDSITILRGEKIFV